ncbi:tyrosine--tRNA ligase [Mycoplasmopsis anatis]|uniref:Tyrosine--tRNA ligase n=1 Tax=Mycoplasmopsis anatis TaxID=171279 RepID=A0A9Q3L8N4_9BACT|nr:tyrosine--tRNA ligase [Mycoplasmopsis anatis]MBW0594680.1 tyrosine--tRNA ligase [Mycoplasmopsis anatis]MBW0595058.1 tyrosine--tRNA ligase [Mycoplasmopsis anatis]MBW0596627.1 tyrosine--tRNA ligase [Mycoplasmopsis anatis]MBW0598196.1 tyrosine--tRNA ligase [Mycoplasmopsis anatis]MBW0599016.1 tyrosine--tRNA ligase [Mycoplasmopsis anatis]
MNILNELKERGILKNISSEEKFNSLEKGTKVYIGFDPTAQSLHLGNYIQIKTLQRFKQAGFTPIMVVGGATGMIGDPSGRNSERNLLDTQTLESNKNKIRQQLSKFDIDVVDNYDFYKDMNILYFLREVGKLISINYMLSKDVVSSRLENGISFTEFSYQLIQGWDFYQLYKLHNTKVQIGGSDQWGNITTGLEIISKKCENPDAVGITLNLLTDENGNKFGKSTGGGSLWLDKEMNSPYNLYQFLFNQPDSQIEKLLLWLTSLEINEIKSIIKKHFESPSLQDAQRILAFEVVKDIHGIDEAQKSFNLSQFIYNPKFDITSLNLSEFENMIDHFRILEIPQNSVLIDELMKNNVFSSKRELREFIQNKSLKLNFHSVDENTKVISDLFDGKYAIINKGKKQIFILKIV